jgi:ribose transport system permease protein
MRDVSQAPAERAQIVRPRLPNLGTFGPIWVATAALFALSPLLASGSLSNTAIESALLPFAGILAIAAIGQTLVIQQGGLDLSVPGTLSLGVVLAVTIPEGRDGDLWLALAVVLAVGLAAGLVNGLFVTRLGVTPLVATLGMNAVLLGVMLEVSGGSIAYRATSNLNDFANSEVFGISTLAVLAAGIVLATGVLMRRTIWGRRFELVGASPLAARAAGISVERYQLASYVAAGACYAVAGALLAGKLGSPQLFAGNDYLLPTIAAVVLGGTALGGGRGSVVATAGGVLFFSQLEQIVQIRSDELADEYLVQGAIVALAMGIRGIPWRRVLARNRVGSLVEAGPTTKASVAPVGGDSSPGEVPGAANGAPRRSTTRTPEEEEKVDVNP